MIVLFALVLDIRSTIYFKEDIKTCHFGNNVPSCYCDATFHLYESIFGDLGPLDCYNAATRNTSILEANIAFSVACLLLTTALLASLLTGFASYFIAWLHAPIVADRPNQSV